MHPPSYIFFTIILLLTILLGSCSSTHRHPLLVGTHVWLGYEPLFLARQLGYFSSNEIRLLEFTSNTDSIHALRQGTLDAAALTLDEVLLLAQENLDFKIVLIMDFSHGGDAILSQDNIASIDELRDKTVGVENSTVSAFMLSRALEIHGLSVADINIVPLELFEHEQAFTSGKVDAVVTFEPVRSKLLAQGAKQIFDSSKIPGEIVDILVVRSAVLEQHQDNLHQLLRSWFKAISYLQKHKDDAVEHMTKRLGLSEQEINSALSGLRFPSLKENFALLNDENAQLAISGKKLIENMKRSNLLKKEVHLPPLLTDEPLKSL